MWLNNTMKNNEHNFAEELWEYSCNLYAYGEVKKACLYLQDNFHADVNVLLYLCWLAHTQTVVLDRKFIETVIKISGQWQKDVVEPLRQLRKQISSMRGLDARKVKTSLLSSELEAEKSEQQALADIPITLIKNINKSPSVADKKKKLEAALLLYFEIILHDKKGQLNKQGRTQLESLLVSSLANLNSK